MSAYENKVVGKLRLKGKALEVKADGINKKKKKYRHHHPPLSTGGHGGMSTDDLAETDKDAAGQAAKCDYHLTPAERKYLEQTQKLVLQRLTKMAAKSHRDRIQEFNQYLANLTEHYDIPKVGPG